MKELNLYKDIEPDMKNPVHDMFRRNQSSRMVDVLFKICSKNQVAILGEKEIFGEEELWDPSKRKYKVIVHSTEGEVYEIKKTVCSQESY